MAEGLPDPSIAQRDLEIRKTDRQKLLEFADRYGINKEFFDLYQTTLGRHLTREVLNLGVTGESGSGKSSLINTIRHLIPSDEGAARTGTSETTFALTPYFINGLDEVILWDLPGVGTHAFPQKNYIEKVKFDCFDSFIICTSTRFTENDMWLATMAQKHHIPYYFVRTKIDQDITNAQDDHGFSEIDALRSIKDHTIEAMQRCQHRTDNLYFISSKLRNQTKWDFRKLMDNVHERMSTAKQDIIILAVVAYSSDLIEKKKVELMRNIDMVAQSAASSVLPYQRIIQQQLYQYKRSFYITDEDLRKWEIQETRLDDQLRYLKESLNQIEEDPFNDQDNSGFFAWLKKSFRSFVQRDNGQRIIQQAQDDYKSGKEEAIKIAITTALEELIENCADMAQEVLKERQRLVEA